MKYPVLETSMLWDCVKGIHKITTYYDDGSIEERLVPLSPIIIPKQIWCE